MEHKIISTNSNDDNTERVRNLLGQIFTRNDTVREELMDFFSELGIPVRNDQIQMILGVIRMLKFTAEKIKVPLSNVVSLQEDADVKQTIDKIMESGHSRIPVYLEKDGQKNFTGLLYAKEALRIIKSKKKTFRLREYLRDIQVIPETQSLLSLLREMRLNSQHMMLTANEHGEITGLITLEDILEEIVGEIKDEHDTETFQIRDVGNNLYEVNGSINLTDINKDLAVNLPDEKFNTLAGFLLHEKKGKIKKNATVKYGDITLEITEHEGKKIKKVQIYIPPSNL